MESYSSLCLRQEARETTCPRLGMCVQLRLECSFVHEHPLLQMLVPTVSGIKALSFPNHDLGTSKGQVTIILKSPGLSFNHNTFALQFGPFPLWPFHRKICPIKEMGFTMICKGVKRLPYVHE